MGEGGGPQAGDENTKGPGQGGPEQPAEDQSPGAPGAAPATSTAGDATPELVPGLLLLRLAALADDLPAGLPPEDPRFLDVWDKDELLSPDALARLEEVLSSEAPQQAERAPGLESPIPTVVELRSGGASETGHALLAFLAAEAPPAWGPQRSHPAAVAPSRLATPGRAADPLRLYKIAIGLVPALAVFGYTPATLRDHVETARRAWRRFHDRRRAGR